MLFVRAGLVAVMIATLSATPTFAARAHRAPTSGHARSSAHSTHKAKVSKTSKGSKETAHAKKAVSRGQRGIDPDRAREIQEALIRENYLSGEPTGQWDSATETAMQRYQADHGWQTKLTPDSRALIKLGLGPNHGSTAVTPASGTQVTPGSSATNSSFTGSSALRTSALN